jgi:integrase
LARKTGQIVGRGRHRWLVRVFLGRDRETRKRRYHSRIGCGPVRHAQTYLNKVLRDHDLGRQIQGADVTLNEYRSVARDCREAASAREKLPQLRKPVAPICPAIARRSKPGDDLPLDIQAAYQQLVERGLSARTIRYTHSVLCSSMRQAIRWRLLLEDPTNGAHSPLPWASRPRSFLSSWGTPARHSLSISIRMSSRTCKSRQR